MSKLPFVTLNHYTPAGFQTQDVVLKEDAEKLEAENKRLRAALGEIADYDYQCQCVDGIETGEENFGCPSCWARAALKEPT
jgi:hypothetical protein